jgi:hypothetical protein
MASGLDLEERADGAWLAWLAEHVLDSAMGDERELSARPHSLNTVILRAWRFSACLVPLRPFADSQHVFQV